MATKKTIEVPEVLEGQLTFEDTNPEAIPATKPTKKEEAKAVTVPVPAPKEPTVRSLTIELNKIKKRLAAAEATVTERENYINQILNQQNETAQTVAIIKEQNKATLLTVLNTLKNTVNIVTLLATKGEIE